MNNILVATPSEKREITLHESLFNDFITYIDRSEKTTRTYIVNLKQFIVWMRFEGVTQPTREDILSYRQYLSSEHDAIQLYGDTWRYRTDSSGNRIKIYCKSTTVKQYLRSVCQFFKWTASNGFYPDVASNIHAPKVKYDVHRKEAFTADEVRAIETSITSKAAADLTEARAKRKDTEGRIQRATEKSKRLYAMYLLTVTAGLRMIELSRANVKDLETRRGQTWLYVWGKGQAGATQKKAIAPEVAKAIQDYLAARPGGSVAEAPLFASLSPNSTGQRLTTRSISRICKTAFLRTGINSPRITCHSLRHTAATLNLLNGGTPEETQQLLRHRNPATTQIYSHALQRGENNSEERITAAIFSAEE